MFNEIINQLVFLGGGFALLGFLNRHYGEHFNVNVNRHRVDEAMGLLTSSPDLSITAIACQVGFNSKSAFYLAFSWAAGMSPSRYREDNGFA